ncbi:MAG: nicotinate-nucleotide--dimethylbenzimidazole phosphoribosyltransferase, partial [Sporomusa sp.]
MLKQTVAGITALDTKAMERCQLRIDNLTKPLNSLGSFEHIARRLAGITGDGRPRRLKKSIIIMAADNGVAEQGDCSCRQMTTLQRITSFCHGDAPVKVFAEHVAASTVLVDIGVAAYLPSLPELCHEKLAFGTRNILKE